VYAKIFTQIYDSSIADDWQVRVVFEDLLILANPDGEVDMTPESISARTRIPLEIIKRALHILQQPDPKSRTPDQEGRRLVLLNSHRDWGWLIVNYEKYRSIKREFDRRSYMRKYMSHKRKTDSKTKCLTGSNQSLTSPSPSPSCTEGGMGGEKCNALPALRNAAEVELPQGFPRTSDEAITQAAFAGCDPVFATSVWNKAMGRGGNDAKDVPIRSFRHHLATEWAFEKDRRNRPNGHAGKLFPRDIKLQMDATQKDIDTHPANRESAAYCGRPTQLQLASLTALRKRLKDLNSQLSGYIPNA